MRAIKTITISALAMGLLAGSAAGVAAQEEPVEVTGQVVFSPGGPGSIETWETTDPRLTGEGRWAPSEGSPSERAPDYFLNSRTLSTDDGSWRQLPVPWANIVGMEEDPYFDLVFIGEGGYEGLVFIAQATWTDSGFDVRGYLVDGAFGDGRP